MNTTIIEFERETLIAGIKALFELLTYEEKTALIQRIEESRQIRVV